MRLIYLLLVALALPLCAFTQKQDFIWYTGYDADFGTPGTDNIILDFNSNKMNFHYANLNMEFMNSNSSICSKEGNMLLFTNNCTIYKSAGSPVLDGNYINDDYAYQEYCVNQGGYRVTDNGVILPDPADINNYYFIYYGVKYQYHPAYFAYVPRLAYTKIVSNSQNAFAVTIKDEPVIEDTLSGGQLKPIRHANGRDWWLIVPRYKVNQYYIYLLDPSGIHFVHTQAIGPETNYATLISQAAVSPDGSKYCRYSAPGGLLVFDFDRCAGILNNFRYGGSAVDIFNCNGNGLAISPNSRFLYLGLCDSLFQFDLADQDIFASRKVVKDYTGPDEFEGLMDYAYLAPDGKIYLTTGSGSWYTHIINYPDLPGLACGVEHKAIRFDNPKVNFPNLPNFRLGPIDGSVCDSLGLDNIPWAHWRWQSDTVSALTAWFRDLSAYEPDTWQWNFDDPASGSTNESADRNPVHQFSGPGTYHVCLTVSNVYGTDTFCRDLSLSGVSTESPLSADEMLTRPNPVQSDWEILLKTPLAVSATMILYDISGRQAAKYTLPRGTVTQRIILDDLPAGLYAWVLEGAGVRLAQGKVVKME